MSTLKQVVSNPMPQSTQDDSEEWSIDAHWPTLVHGLADQITQSLSALQNNLDQLLLKERITRVTVIATALAFAKAGVVMFVFMDLARAPLVLRLVATAWLACVLCALVAIYAGLLG